MRSFYKRRKSEGLGVENPRRPQRGSNTRSGDTSRSSSGPVDGAAMGAHEEGSGIEGGELTSSSSSPEFALEASEYVGGSLSSDDLNSLLVQVLSVIQVWSASHGMSNVPPNVILSQLSALAAAYEAAVEGERRHR